MKARLIAAALLLMIASTASAKSVKVYIFAEPEGRVDGFVAGAVSAALLDSVHDLNVMLPSSLLSGLNGLRLTKHREEARIIVQVMSREEVQGEFRVHVHVTLDGRATDLVGTSTHQWKQAAGQLGDQLAAWAKTHPEGKS